MVVRKFMNLLSLIKGRGGIMGSLSRIYRMDDLKCGELIGTDKYGNKYYENRVYFYGRHRWVEYPDAVHLNYDASQVPGEWFGWLHHTTDLPPHEDPNRPKYDWIACHTENMSGTSGQYVPYDTTLPKIEAWQPPRKKDKKKRGKNNKDC